MSLNNYEILEILQKEENVALIKMRNKIDGNIYLLKNINVKRLNKNQKERAINEIQILSSLNHPNIIKFKEAFFDKPSNTLNLAMEYTDNDNLSVKIHFASKKKLYLEESIIWDVLIQILIGLNYLHKKGIIHKNIKSKNIFLTRKRLVKITDFSSCYIINKENKNKYQTGLESYIAPELLKEQQYNDKCDIWSVGCIAYEMASLSLPFKGKDNESLFNNISSGKFNPVPDFYSKNLKSLINDMLIIDPTKRPSIDNILNNSIIQEKKVQIKIIYNNYYKTNANTKNVNNNIILLKNNLTENNSKKKVKIINNSTYRTLKQRKKMKMFSEESNKISRNQLNIKNNKFVSISTDINNKIENFTNNNNSNPNFIHFSKKNIVLNNIIPTSLSIYNTNINSLLLNKYRNNLNKNNNNNRLKINQNQNNKNFLFNNCICNPVLTEESKLEKYKKLKCVYPIHRNTNSEPSNKINITADRININNNIKNISFKNETNLYKNSLSYLKDKNENFKKIENNSISKSISYLNEINNYPKTNEIQIIKSLKKTTTNYKIIPNRKSNNNKNIANNFEDILKDNIIHLNNINSNLNNLYNNDFRLKKQKFQRKKMIEHENDISKKISKTLKNYDNSHQNKNSNESSNINYLDYIPITEKKVNSSFIKFNILKKSKKNMK